MRTRVPGALLRARALALAPRLPRSSQAAFATSTAKQRDPRTRPSDNDDTDLGRHFYLNKVLEQWAARHATRMTLRQLVFFGKTLGRERDKILKSANYVRQELPIRIAHRIRDLQALPFVVMTNPHLENVYTKYWQAFERIRRIPPIRTMEDNERFCAAVKGLLEDHLTIIPSLTIGIVESSPHLPPAQLDAFMERMLRSRISRRVLAEQHIALSEALDDPFHFFNDAAPPISDTDDVGDHVGIIYTHLSVASVINKGVRLLRQMFARAKGLSEPDETIPDVTVDGDLRARFAYIPEHLEYITFELLKNAMRATMRHHEHAQGLVPSVRVTIVEGPPEEDLIIRISDAGGGLPNLVNQLVESPPLQIGTTSLTDVGQTGVLPNTVTNASPIAAGAYAAPGPGPSSFATLPPNHGPPSTYEPGLPLTARATPHATSISALASSRDPLIDVLCSFSNVRRRLELEEERRQGAQCASATGGNGSTSREQDEDAAVATLSPDIGLGSRETLEALKNVGTFKGTVTEQVKLSPQSSSKLGASLANDKVEGLPSSALSSPSWAPRGDEGTGQAALHTVHAETGLGLPMAKVYCDFFGGSLTFRSLDGHSTDVYIRLPKLGTKKESIEEIVL